MKKKIINQIRKTLYKNKIKALILTMIISLLLSVATMITTVYIKNNMHKVVVYQTYAFLTINNTSNNEVKKEEKTEEKTEEKPIVIKKAPVNDKEDVEKKYSDPSISSAKSSNVEEAKSLYEVAGSSVGIDVSKWNYSIDWKKVADSGVEFAMIRCGYRGYGSGEILMDPYFEQNITGALKNGIKVGVYFFSAAINEEEAKEEARWVINVIKKYRITYPVAYDFESFGMGRLVGLSNTQMTNNAIAFLQYIKSNGYTPMMYASKNAYYQRWETSRITGCKLWLAHYTDNTDYTGTYHMWQYTSKGNVPGINTNVDMNIAYFKYSNSADAKEEVKEENEPETTKEEIKFKEQKDKVIVKNNTYYYNDINSDSKKEILKDTILSRLELSENEEWSKVVYNDLTVYIKNEDLNIYIEENTDN